MLIPYVSRNIILPFNPFVPNPLAPGNRTIYPHVEMLHLVVAVQCLPCGKRGLPGATRLMAEVSPPSMCLFSAAEPLEMNA